MYHAIYNEIHNVLIDEVLHVSLNCVFRVKNSSLHLFNPLINYNSLNKFVNDLQQYELVGLNGDVVEDSPIGACMRGCI